MSIREIIRHGWLIKSPHDSKDSFIRNIFKKKKWKRRYFLLTMVTQMRSTRTKEVNLTSSTPSLASSKTFGPPSTATLELSYYESERMSKKIGTIDLERCEEVLSHLQSDSFQHVFAIRTFHGGDTPRTYFLVADSEHDMTNWVTQLCRYLKMIHEGPMNRHSNRSSAGPSAHHQIHSFQHFPSLSTTALDGRSLSKTPTPPKKPTSVDYTDSYSLCSLPRNVTLSRLNSFSRTTPYSPYIPNPHPNPLPSPLLNPIFNQLPQCSPPTDYHELLPLMTPSSTLSKSRLQYQAEQKLSTEDKSFVYFTESVTQLLQMQMQLQQQQQQQHQQHQSKINDEHATANYYDTPRKTYEDEEMHFYHNRISEFYDVPGSTNHGEGSNVYSREKEPLEASGNSDEFEGVPEFYASCPEREADSARGVYSIPCKISNPKRDE